MLAAVAVTSFQCSDDDSSPEEPKGTGKSITSFKLSGLTPTVTATINDGAAKAITATVPVGTNVTALVPTIEISADASVSPTSGTAQNFTSPVTYTVTAEDGSKQLYTVTITVAEDDEVTCYPTVLPNDDLIMSITYNTDHQVARVVYREVDEEDTDYHSEFEYTNGKRSRVNVISNDEVVAYTTFTYTAETIVESYFGSEREGELTLENFYIYHLTNGRVTSWAYYNTFDNEEGTRLDSAAFTYTNDNVTRMDGYGSGEELQWHILFEYDDKTNVYALTGLNGDGDGYLTDPLVLSKNNQTRAERLGSSQRVEEIAYTYNEQGLPLTQSVDGAMAQTFTYDCQ